MYSIYLAGIVVQLVRAPPCQGGSCGFEPRQSRTRIRLIEKFIFIFSVKRKIGSKMKFRWGIFSSFFCFAFLIRQRWKFQFLPLVSIYKVESYVYWYNRRYYHIQTILIEYFKRYYTYFLFRLLLINEME